MSPRNGQLDTTFPYKPVHCYEWRHPAVEVSGDSSDEQANVKVGDEVWVKLPSEKGTQQWTRGEVTGVNLRNNVEVDGMLRHVLDIIPVISAEEVKIEPEQSTEDEVIGRPCSQRQRRLRVWMRDYTV
ncbi:Gag-Pro-Pol polyprotein [Elysia marginata]|uniref:Gag-Pro-Pol polyprotein n=1 Tax=Elysia marginata TaxID=1093978 RepID=A0AAV4GSK1_9GAST|nr:Gag-Pro-Pol polyprotein [Elysia marginata]